MWPVDSARLAELGVFPLLISSRARHHRLRVPAQGLPLLCAWRWAVGGRGIFSVFLHHQLSEVPSDPLDLGKPCARRGRELRFLRCILLVLLFQKQESLHGLEAGRLCLYHRHLLHREQGLSNWVFSSCPQQSPLIMGRLPTLGGFCPAACPVSPGAPRGTTRKRVRVCRPLSHPGSQLF